MRSQFLKTAVAALLVSGVLVGTAYAKKTSDANESSKTKPKSYIGTVEVTKNKVGDVNDVNAVDLKVGQKIKHTYHITLDEKGKELGQKMAGKKVNVKGMLSEKAGAEWLTVKEYSMVAPKPAKKATKS
jgi:hypothetical protein